LELLLFFFINLFLLFFCFFCFSFFLFYFFSFSLCISFTIWIIKIFFIPIKFSQEWIRSLLFYLFIILILGSINSLLFQFIPELKIRISVKLIERKGHEGISLLTFTSQIGLEKRRVSLFMICIEINLLLFFISKSAQNGIIGLLSISKPAHFRIIR